VPCPRSGTSLTDEAIAFEVKRQQCAMIATATNTRRMQTIGAPVFVRGVGEVLALLVPGCQPVFVLCVYAQLMRAMVIGL
jgi:hypothetical protein